MKLSRKVMQPRMFFLVSHGCTNVKKTRHLVSRLFTEGYVSLSFVQFNDALMYTTPVQSGQYKLNSVLSLAGMKVRGLLFFSQAALTSFRHAQSEVVMFDFWVSFLQVSKPSQEAYQNELNIESVERSFILSARSALCVFRHYEQEAFIKSGPDCSDVLCVFAAPLQRETSGWRPSPKPLTTTRRRKLPSYPAGVRKR